MACPWDPTASTCGGSSTPTPWPARFPWPVPTCPHRCPETQRAISANARNKIFFDVAPEDAVDLAKHTLPELDAHDLSHQDAHHAAARLVSGRQSTPAFTLLTLPPVPTVGETTALRQACALRDTAGDEGKPSGA